MRNINHNIYFFFIFWPFSAQFFTNCVVAFLFIKIFERTNDNLSQVSLMSFFAILSVCFCIVALGTRNADLSCSKISARSRNAEPSYTLYRERFFEFWLEKPLSKLRKNSSFPKTTHTDTIDCTQ